MRYALLLLLVSSRPADACSIACSDVQQIRVISPAPDARSVPLNAEIKILGSGAVPLLTTLDGGIVNVEATLVGAANDRFVRLRPKTPLAPDTVYAVRITDGGVHSVFSTGSATDTQPPSFEGIQSDESTGYQGGLSCGSPRSFKLTLADAQDDATPKEQLFYVGYLGPGADQVDLDKPALAIAGPGTPRLGGLDEGCIYNYRLADGERLGVVLTAVDYAGNESTRGKARTLVESSPCGCAASTAAPLAVALLVVGRALASRRRASAGAARTETRGL